jgi:micrococcal nuclease
MLFVFIFGIFIGLLSPIRINYISPDVFHRIPVISSLFSGSSEYNEGKIRVTLASHIDGDTTRFYIDGVDTTVRYLAIDTKEVSQEETTVLGQIASDYVKELLENARKIEIELEPYRELTDRYGRTLAWIWVDDVLLQEELVKLGLAEIRYTQGNEKYLDRLEKAQK